MLGSISILVVDDCPSDYELYQFLLEEDSDDNFIFHYAPMGEKGLKLFQELSPDCVLLDFNLPDMTGLEFLDELSKTHEKELLPVIVLTGVGNESIAVKSMKSGAKDYLVKEEVSAGTLLRAIKNTVEKVQLRYELTKAQQELISRERMHAMGEMASGIAHDFNNSLTPILGFTDVLIEGHTAGDYPIDKTLRFLQLIYKSAKDAAVVVKRLYQFYKPQKTCNEIIELGTLLDEVILLTRPKWKDQAQIEGKLIRFVKELEEDLPLIAGNESELRELLINLLFNAVDAIQESGKIIVGLTQEIDCIALTVMDTGRGMSEEVRSRCFEPFFTTKDSRGSGLGLAMVYGIVQRHGGSISVDSIPGEGTSFTIRFPLSKNPAGSKKPDDFLFFNSEAQRILLVDDEELNLAFMGEVLRKDGHHVESAMDGLSGWDTFQKGQFDLVITDFSMPHMSGGEMAAKIRGSNPDIPVIMVTGFGDIMEENQKHPQFVDVILPKPVEVQTLREAVFKAQIPKL